jgi:hypothetical protein
VSIQKDQALCLPKNQEYLPVKDPEVRAQTERNQENYRKNLTTWQKGSQKGRNKNTRYLL